jgi:hypothetical protein
MLAFIHIFCQTYAGSRQKIGPSPLKFDLKLSDLNRLRKVLKSKHSKTCQKPRQNNHQNTCQKIIKNLVKKSSKKLSKIYPKTLSKKRFWVQEPKSSVVTNYFA